MNDQPNHKRYRDQERAPSKGCLRNGMPSFGTMFTLKLLLHFLW
jgi:hypothetical protein